MKLYHFTALKNLDSITEQGLVPAVGKNSAPVITLGLPVVWLTSKPEPTWMIGCPDNLCMLVLNMRRDNKRLFHWRTWLRYAECHGEDEHGKPARIVGKEILDILDAHTEPTPLVPDPIAAAGNYFIYAGTIRPRRIIEARTVKYVVAAA